MTPEFTCGFECGVAGGSNQHIQIISGTASFDTTIKRSGSRSLRCNPTAGTARVRPLTQFTGVTRHIGRIYIRFETAVPTADTVLVRFGLDSAGPNIAFKSSDSKLYAAVGTTLGATGASVTTGTWYRLDYDFNVNTSGADFCDVKVDGTALGQATATGTSTAANTDEIGVFNTCTADVYYDDLIWSSTAADYPIGGGYVNHFVPIADGTHNIAGSGDFQRTLTGTDILNSTTTAFQLVDDVPLESGTSVDWINMVAPPNAGDYVECVFGPASGISTPTTGPRAVEIIAGIHQAGTGTGNMEIRIKDNATQNALYSATTVAGVTTVAYKRKFYATAIAGGGAWVAGGGGDGDFNNLKVRFGSPAALDVNPDQYFDCILIEAEFAEASGALTQSASDDINNLADARGLGYGNLHAESINNLADAAQVALGLPLTLSDNVNNLADGRIVALGLPATGADSLQALTDALVKVMSYELAFADSEAANWADAHQLLLAHFLALADSYTLSDATALRLEQREVFADTLIALSDAVASQLGTTLTAADSITILTDSITLRLGYSISASDALPTKLDYATACLYVLGIEIECVDSEARIGLEFYDNAANLADAIALQLGHNEQFTDSYTLTDAETHTLSYQLALSDNANVLADSYTQREGQLVAFSDSFTLNDSLALGYGLVITDNANNLADAYSQQLIAATNERQIVVSDSINVLADELALGYGLRVADNVSNLSDVLTKAVGVPRTFSDTLTALTDAEVNRLGYGVNLGDSLSLDDSINLQLGTRLPLSDVITLTDAAAIVEGQRLTLTDNASNLADSLVKTVGLSLILADNGPTLTDAQTTRLGHLFQLDDAITLTDAFATFGTNALVVADSFALTDGFAFELRGPDFNFNLVDTLILTDAIVIELRSQVQLSLALTDAIILVDHYFDIRYPYSTSLKRHVVVPSRARVTTLVRERVAVVPGTNRTTKVS